MPVDVWDSTTAHWDSPLVLWDNGSDLVPPTVPTGFTATAISGGRVDLHWTASTDNTAVAGYEIYRGGVLITVLGTVTSYSDTSVTELTTYSYAIRAKDTSNNFSSLSSPASATTPAFGDIVPPNPPTVVTATAITGTRIDIGWSGATDNVGVTGYEIWRDGSLLVTLGTILSYSDITVAQLTTYSYRIKALDAAGNASALSSASTATTPASLDISPPSPPNVVTAVVSSSRIDLSWSGATDNVAVTGYKVFRDAILVATLGAVTTYIDAPLAPSTTYTYTVRALDAAGNQSGPSPPATGTTPADSGGGGDTTPPSVVSLTALVYPVDVKIQLDWTAATDDIGVTNYEIYRGGVILRTVAGDVLTFTDTTPLEGVVYSYTVRARDAAGNVGIFSGAVTAMVPPPDGGGGGGLPPGWDNHEITNPDWGADDTNRSHGLSREVMV